MRTIEEKITGAQMTAHQAIGGNFGDIQMIPSRYAMKLINETLDNIMDNLPYGMQIHIKAETNRVILNSKINLDCSIK